MKRTIFLCLFAIFALSNCAKNYKAPTQGIDPRNIKPLFFFATKTSTCVPAENVNGKNFRPEEIMDNYPECFMNEWKDAGTYVLDCKSSKLSTSFFYADTEEKCKAVAENYGK